MPTTKLNNLIIFGDSMSDMGRKWTQGMGRVARAMSLMRVNECGRYSDGRNWADFLFQWAGGRRLIHDDAKASWEDTKVHLSLTQDSNQDTGFGRPFFFVNYAEGGAMGASDRPSTGLGVFKEQATLYLKERTAYAKERNDFTGHTMHIIWFGLNDLVTNKRPPDTMWKVVDEMAVYIKGIADEFGKSFQHFLVVNLPSPSGAVRFIKGNDLMVVAALERGALLFNEALNGLKNGRFLPGSYASQVTLCDMYSYIAPINDNPEKYKLVAKAQKSGIKVNYGTLDDSDEQRDYVATSDDAHPTEAVYKLIGKKIASDLRENYELGDLSKSKLL